LLRINPRSEISAAHSGAFRHSFPIGNAHCAHSGSFDADLIGNTVLIVRHHPVYF
jgi:hypothetical protein